jgi:DDE superfamily endonuclease
MVTVAHIINSTDRVRRRTYSLSIKRHIVVQAYYNGSVNKQQDHINKVAKFHKVRASQIRSWKEKFDNADHSLLFDLKEINVNNNNNGSTLSMTTDISPITCDDSSITGYNTNGTTNTSQINYEELDRNNRKKYNRVAAKHLTRFPPACGIRFKFSEKMLIGLKEFFFEQRSLTNSVSVCMLRLQQARRIDDDEVESIPNNNPYKPYHALNQRLYRLLEHWDQTWRRGTHRAQNTRYCNKLIADFLEYIEEKIVMLDISRHVVFNIDETNVPFSLEQLYTWGQRGANTISIRKPQSSQRCSCLLGCNMTGTLKIQPHLVFKGMPGRSNAIQCEIDSMVGYSDACTYAVQNKAWFDELTFLNWINDVWKPFLDCNGIMLAYLLLDECTVHMTKEIRDALQTNNTEYDFIPGGYTSKLQPLDVGINAPFKSNIRSQVEVFMMNNSSRLTVKVHRRDVSVWIENAWNSITQQTIVNSWKKAGFNTVSLLSVLRMNDDDYSEDDGDILENKIIGHKQSADADLQTTDGDKENKIIGQKHTTN